MHWNLSLKTSEPNPMASSASPSFPEASASNKAPRIVISTISADTGHLEFIFSPTESAILEGVIVKAEPTSDHQWTGTATADTVKMVSLKANPFLAYDLTANFLSSADSLQLNSVDCRCHPGEITGRVTYWFGEKPGIESDLNFVQISLEPLLPAAWDGKVNGIASGNVAYSNRDSVVTAHGHISVEQTIFNLFPVLSTISHWLQTSDVGSLTLDHAETSFLYSGTQLRLTDLDLQKPKSSQLTVRYRSIPNLIWTVRYNWDCPAL